MSSRQTCKDAKTNGALLPGLFNPAVTLGLAMIGGIPWVRAGLVFIAEIFGAMASAGVVSALFPGPLAVTTTLGSGTSIVRGLCKPYLHLSCLERTNVSQSSKCS